MPKRKVLIVEDETAICDSMRAILERRGCIVFTSVKTEEALEIFQKERPGAVVIDIHMSYSTFDGMEFLKRIRQIDKDVLCVMITCVADEKTKQEALALGAKEYLVKPLDGDEIRAAVDLLVKGK